MSVIIVGGGIIGTILALALSRLTQGQLPVHLVEAMPHTSSHPSFDARAIAFAHGTCQQLTRIGIWQELAHSATAINTVHISEHGHSGFVSLEARNYYLNALGQVIELQRVGQHLFQLLKEANGITVHCPSTISEFIRTEKEVNVILSNGSRLTAKLLIAADGSSSSIGTACGIARYQRSYGQAAIIANISTSVTHGGRAFERFAKHGPLAMLPISRGGSALVWCHPLAKVKEVLAWPDSRFCKELQKSFGWRLGRIIDTSKRSAYPLTLTTSSRFISHRAVLVGNAAQTLHPIAGQGFNLGLRDVMSLAETLTHAWTKKKDCGDWTVLCQYQARRQIDKAATIALTDGLVHLFSNHWSPLVVGRNLGLIAMELFIPAHNALALRTLGLVER